MTKLMKKFKYFCAGITETFKAGNLNVFKPAYRVVSIEKDKYNDYEVMVQIIGKYTTFRMKPEEILADDKMTDLFSPRDVRTLTYLGYLGVNSPKYRILAKRLSEKDNRMIFALQKKGEKSLEVKTANEISRDKEILKQIDQEDAHMIGYTAGGEAMLEEKLTKEALLEKNKKNTNGLKLIE